MSEELSTYRLKINHLINNYDEWLKLNSLELINKLIVDKIISKMQQNKFSDKIWQNTAVDGYKKKKDKIIITIKSEYFAETGFDVALAREVGTKDHWVRPTVKKALSWISSGIRLFSSGHMVSGIKSLYIIRNEIRDGTPLVRQELGRRFAVWQLQVLSGKT